MPTWLEQDYSSLAPEYPPSNICLRGFDFHVLESYQSYVHNVCENMGIDVSER